MACATLKRPLEFDPLHSPAPTKRQRCMPMCISPSNSPPRNLSSPPRPSTSSSGTMTNTPFVSCVAKLSPDVIANGIFEEMKRLHRRKELHLPLHNNTSAAVVAAASSASPSAGAAGSLPQTNASDDRDTPMFTFRQVEYICSKMLSEQEGRLRCEYDAILNEKLKEQFDIFNRFSVDQIDRLARHNNSQSLSYLS